MQIVKVIIMMVLVSLVSIQESLAFDALSITTDSDKDHNWGEYGYYVEDKKANLTADQVSQLSPTDFTRLPSNSYSFGFQSSAYWIRLEIHAEQSQEQLISLGIDTSNLILYKQQSQGLNQVYAYDPFTPQSKRQVQGIYPSSRLYLDKGENVYFLRVSSSLSDIRFNHLTMRPEQSFYDHFDFHLFKFSLHLGLLACMIFLNFFFYFHSRKDVNFIYYLVYLTAFWFLILIIDNLGLKYLWPDKPLVNIWVFRLSTAFTFIGLLAFTHRFLQLSTYSTIAHRLFGLQIAFYMFSVLIYLIDICLGPQLTPISSFQLHGFIYKVGMAFSNFSILLTVLFVYLKGHKPARFFLIAFSCFIMGAIGLNLTAKGINVFGISTLTFFNIFLLGSTLEVLLINLALFDKQKMERQAFLAEIDLKNQQLEKTNKAYFRFVPQSFLKELGRHSIENVKLGDQKMRQITIMFVDIRSYTSLTENMTPEENTEFINRYFAAMIPCVENHGGVIDKFIGDCIMGLFFRAEDALASAKAMRQALLTYNEERRHQGLIPIDNGIGIHTGLVMMATVGNQSRLSTTVYSDAVNTAARLESLTKNVGASILISEEVRNNLPENQQKDLAVICLGQTKVKGKDKPVKIYHYFAHENPQAVALKRQYTHDLEELVRLLENNHQEEALAKLEQLEQVLPEDSIVRSLRVRLVAS